MSRNKQAIGLLSALILALAFLPILDQPSLYPSLHDGPGTAQEILYAGVVLEHEGVIEFGTFGGLFGAATAAYAEFAGIFGWWGAATVSAISSAAVVTMGAAA